MTLRSAAPERRCATSSCFSRHCERSEAIQGPRDVAPGLLRRCAPRNDGSGGPAMRIRELKTFVVGNPPPTFGGRYFLFLKLVTDDGIEGLGEVYAASFGPKAIVAMIEDVFEHHVLGADPFRIETLWRNVYDRGYSGRPDISLMGVLSGIAMAMWDLVGKAVDKPVYALLGGKVHEKLRSYTYLYPDGGADAYDNHPVYNNPDAAAARALEYVGQGFTAVKFDPAGPYSTFDPRQPSLERLHLSEAFCRV